MNADLKNIRREFLSFSSSLSQLNERKLISFAFKLQNFNPLSHINELNQFFDDIFFLRNPNSDRTIIGINSAIEFVVDDGAKFSDAYNNYAYWKKNLFSNWKEFSPSFNTIICCSAKFDPSKTFPIWNDFKPLRIYTPEIVFSCNRDEIIGYFNFISEKENNGSELLVKLENYLNIVSELDLNEVEAPAIVSTKLSERNNNEIRGWNDSVAAVLNELNNGSLEKLVLSRVFNFNFEAEINWNKLLQKLYTRFPDCYLFFVKKNNSKFFGSSPEMFLKVTDNIAEVESVAGSAPRGEKSESDNELEKYLRTSDKNHQEHLFVSDFISGILIQYSNDVRIIEEKQIRKLDNIQHLITKISAILNTKENLFELIDSLFPTPAVCGVPKNSAMELIRILEKHDRGLYSGLVGVMDFEGNCELAVTIRSALVNGNQVTAFAGAGLLKNSNPEEEFLETKLKLSAILSLFNNENKSK